MGEVSVIPIFALSPFSPTHLILSLWPFSISQSTHLSLPFFRYLFILLPFPCPLSLPSLLVRSFEHISSPFSRLPFPSHPPLLPFSLFPSLSPAVPVTSPNPSVFPSRRR